MANILTVTEAANVLRTAEDDPSMLDLLPIVDAYITTATGKYWEMDPTIHPIAKGAARILLVRLHEDPGAMAAGVALGVGFDAMIVQLQAIKLDMDAEEESV